MAGTITKSTTRKSVEKKKEPTGFILGKNPDIKKSTASKIKGKPNSTKKETATKPTKKTINSVQAPIVRKATTPKEKAQRDELIESILKSNKPEILPEEFKGKEYEIPNKFVVIVDLKGNTYMEPCPQYCSFNIFKSFLATFPDVPEEGSFNIKSQVSITDYFNGEIVTSAYEGSRRKNVFAEKFPEIQNETKAIGGNLIFTAKDKPFTKSEAIKMMKHISTILNKEELVDIND